MMNLIHEVMFWSEDMMLELVLVLLAVAGWAVLRGSSQQVSKLPKIAVEAPSPKLVHVKPAGDKPTPETVIVAIRDAMRTRQFGRGLDLFRDTEVAKVVTVMAREQQDEYFMAVATCAVRVNRCRVVKAVIREMRTLGVANTPSFYQSSMRLLAKKGFYNEALEVYQEMVHEGIIPTEDACSCMVAFVVDSGNLDQGMDLFRTGAVGVFHPSIRAYMKLMRALSAERTTKGALNCEELYWDMHRRQIPADNIVVNVVLGALVEAGELENASKVMSSAHSGGTLDIVGCNSVLRGLVRSGQAQRAWKLLGEMEAGGLAPTKSTFICFLHGKGEVMRRACGRLEALEKTLAH
mmetsp:Transcript_30505/g.66929  ORF Transcript_30505/g.66929 Transcript_30505/m.66929 type:complete len:350 (-) Transcript_30505:191-1240(-)